MRILIIPSWYPTPDNPVNGIFIREQAAALSRSQKVQVLYLNVLPRGTRRKPARYEDQSRGYLEETIEVTNYVGLWQFAYIWHLVREYMRVRQSFRPDIVNCHIAVPAGFGGAILSKLFQVPIVLTENSSEFKHWQHRPGLRLMARIAFSAANLVIAVSEGQRQRIVSTYGRKRGLVVIPNIVNTDRFTPTPFPSTQEGYRLLFVGLMSTTQKGVPILLEALKRIKAEGLIRLYVDMVGDGTLRPEYEAQAHRLGLDDIVRFHGLQNHEQIAHLMQESHALVLPSLHEAAPLVIIEAMSSGRPAVVTRCGGPEYMVDERTGVVVDPGDVGQLAAAIIELLLHLNRYRPEQIAEIARSRYSYPVIASALERAFRRVVERTRRK